MRKYRILKHAREQITAINDIVDSDIIIASDGTPYKNEKRLLPISLRVYQKRIFKKIFFEKKRKIFKHWSRRAGKDACDFSLICTLAQIKKGTYAYMLPYNVTAKRVIWRNGIQTDKEFIFFKEIIDKDQKVSTNASEMTIELKNGSVIYIVGTDNYDRLRGIFLSALCMSEFAFGKPGVLDVLSPVISQGNAILLINTTPNGYNFSWDLYLRAKESKEWYTELETCETLVDEKGNRYITEAMVNDSIDNGMSKGMVRQEFYCEPFLDANNLYFAEEIEMMIQDRRYYSQEHAIPYKQLHFGWDLGLSDLTVMVGFQVDDDGWFHLVYCEADSMKSWDYWAKRARSVRNHFAAKYQVINKGISFLPHDGARKRVDKNGEVYTITTVEDDFNLCGEDTEIIPVVSFKADAISDAKMLLNKTKISNLTVFKNEPNDGLEKLRKNLQAYRRALSISTKEPTGKPAHDTASHYADAVQTIGGAKRLGLRSI